MQTELEYTLLRSIQASFETFWSSLMKIKSCPLRISWKTELEKHACRILSRELRINATSESSSRN